MNKLFYYLKKCYEKGFLFFCLLANYRWAYAESLIPISRDDQTAEGSNIAATFIKILQKDILPLAELGGACYLLYVCLGGIWKGYQEYQREKDMAPLKHAVIASTIAIVIGGSILFLLDKLRIYEF
jgi:hypothetical protein